MTKATPKKQRKVIAPQPGAQELAMNTKVDFLIYGGAAGCVDADTEFLSQDGWKKISEYVDGDKVFQYDKDTDTGSFVLPEQYVKIPCEKLTRIRGKGIDQCLSDEHRVLLWPTKESAPRVHTLWEIKTRKITGWMKSAVELSGRVEISRTPEVPLDSSVVFEEYPTRDGFKYCFSVPAGFFLIRRNGKVVLTGNSGKSHLLLMHPLQYARDPNFKAVFFRESTALLMGQGGLWQEATKMYADFKCKSRLKPQLTKEFSSGAVFQFMHMQHEDDKFQHKGLQYSAILLDELTEFSETQVIYLMSRLRSDADSDSYMMATTNPDCDSWILKWVEWYLDEEGFPDKTKQGKVRYFYIVDDSPKFADTPEELMEAYPHLSHVVNPLTGEEVIIPPKTFAFIAGTI